MENKERIKQVYELEYDESGFNSGLVEWYNSMIDKSIEELEVEDVARMIRQNILPKLAIDKAIEIFGNDPRAGELYEGEVLEVLCLSIERKIIDSEQFERLATLVVTLDEKIKSIEFEDEEEFRQNLGYILEHHD